MSDLRALPPNVEKLWITVGFIKKSVVISKVIVFKNYLRRVVRDEALVC
jgi:hypothetical protein